MDHLTREAEKRVGKVLRERWTIDALIGVGGMAAVYKATHRNGNEVAIKILHSDISDNEAICKRFQREGYVANRVKHRGAVTVFDDDKTEDGAAFLVMELLRGENVEARRERLGGWLPQSEVLGIADQVLDTLMAAHEQGIVHRDIKPENMFLTIDGVVKVLDFGIARLQSSQQNTNLTLTGAMMGTPGFMSPEQARGMQRDIDAQTDIWGVGASLFTLLCGQLVHEAETMNETLILAATSPARSLSTVLPDLDSGLVALVDKALAWEKRDRWADAKSMQRELRRVAYRLRGGPRQGSSVALELSLSEPLSGPAVASEPEQMTRIGPPPQAGRSQPDLAAAPVPVVVHEEDAPTDRSGSRPAIPLPPHVHMGSADMATARGVEAPRALPPPRTIAAVAGAAALLGIALGLMVYVVKVMGDHFRTPPKPSSSVAGPPPVVLVPELDPPPFVPPLPEAGAQTETDAGAVADAVSVGLDAGAAAVSSDAGAAPPRPPPRRPRSTSTKTSPLDKRKK